MDVKAESLSLMLSVVSMSFRHCVLASAALACVSLGNTAVAGPVEALEAMRDYNLIVFDDFRLNHDIQGGIYVDGNLSNGNMVGSNFTSYSGGSGLTVTGNVTGQNIKVKNSDVRIGGSVSGSIEVQDSGSAYIGGSTPGTVRLTGNTQGRTVQTNDANAVAVLDRADFFGLSADLASRAAEASYSSADILDRNNFRITVADQNNDGIGIVNLAADFFSSVNSYGLYGSDLSSLDTIVINVAGTVVDISANWQTGGLASNLFASQHIIWNFFEAEVLNFGTQIFGSVLAPGAHVSNRTPIDGTLVAGSFTQDGQVHLPGYAGTSLSFATTPQRPGPSPEGSTQDSTILVSEPAALGLLGFGLLGIAGLRRRRMDNGVNTVAA